MPLQVGEADEQITVTAAFVDERVNSFWPHTVRFCRDAHLVGGCHANFS
jgi:hypothetical protein